MLKRLVGNRRGATAIEYGLIASLIGVGSIVALQSTKTGIDDVFCSVSSKMPGNTGLTCAGKTATPGEIDPPVVAEPPAPPPPPPPPANMTQEQYGIFQTMPQGDQDFFLQQYNQCAVGNQATMVFTNGRFNYVSCR